MSAAPPEKLQTLTLPIGGMDCAECSEHVQHALSTLPGVVEARVLLSSEKAIVQIDPALMDVARLRKAVEGAGYSVPEASSSVSETQAKRSLNGFTRLVLTLFGLVFGAVLLVSTSALFCAHIIVTARFNFIPTPFLEPVPGRFLPPQRQAISTWTPVVCGWCRDERTRDRPQNPLRALVSLV